MDDLDDLFRDTAPATQAQAPGLRERVDELRRVGCCDKLTWSPSGVLAFVAGDKKNIKISSYRFRSREGDWSSQITAPEPLPMQIKVIFDGSHIMHLSFNPHGSGSELVVIDTFGRIFCTGPYLACYDRFHVLYAFNSLKSDTHRVVGMHWLTASREYQGGTTFRRETYKDGSSWKFREEDILPAVGPSNPIPATSTNSGGRPAFVTLTTVGKMTLYYSKQDSKPPWDSTSHDLAQIENSNALLTHATICGVPGGGQYPNGDLWVATIDTMQQIHVKSVNIRWQAQQGQQPPQMATPHITHSAIGSMLFVNYQLSDSVPEHVTSTRASFMRLLLDRTVPADDRGRLRLLVVCHTMPETEQDISAGQQPGTVISQYELQMMKPEVDSCFASLTTKQQPRNALRDQLYIRRLDDQKFDGIVLDVREHRHGSMFSFAYSDGRIEYRDKELKIPPLDLSNDSVSGLHAIGFAFTSGEPCLYNVASHHACVRATMDQGHTPKLQPIQASVPLMEVTDPDFKAKASAVFALELLNAAQSAEIVDLIVAMRAIFQQLSPDQAEIFRLSLLHYYIGPGTRFTARLVEPTDKIVGISQIQRFLSVQEALGHGNDTEGRSRASLTAWILLNIRQCWYMMNVSMSTAPGSQKPRIAQPDVAEAVGLYIRWFTTLLDWLLAQILLMNRRMNGARNFKPEEIPFPPHELPTQTPANTHVACTLLGTPFARNLLKAVTSRVMQLQTRIFTIIDPQDMGPEWEPWQQSEDETVVALADFTRFLISCETAWGKIHKAGGGGGGGGDGTAPGAPQVSEAMLREQEANLLQTATFNNQFNIHFLAQLTTAGAVNLRASIDEALLSFRDYTLLGFGMDTAAREFRDRHVWDEPRKRVVAGAAVAGVDGDGAGDGVAKVELKMCMRCGSVTENADPKKAGAVWMVMVSPKCVCGGCWVSVVRKEADEDGREDAEMAMDG